MNMNLAFWTRDFWSSLGYGLGSGPFLIRKIVKISRISDANIIVELGAGYGQVTDVLLQKKSQQTRLIVIENNPERAAVLKEKYASRCEVYEMSAAHLSNILPSASVDLVVSTLPLGSISHDGVLSILGSIDTILCPGGRFIQYQYALQNLSDIKQFFIVKKIFFEILNLWPAFIYSAVKK